MDRRRLIRALPRRTTAGVAALVAAALGAVLLVPDGDSSESENRPEPARAAAPLDENLAQREAVRTGRKVEVATLRTTNSTTYARPDRTFELTSHTAPVRARVDGAWKPIDTNLERTKGGWRPKAAADSVVFHTGNPASKAGFTDMVTLTSGGHRMTVGWPGKLPEPEIDGATALYRGVFDGVDLMLTARDSGYTHVLVVHNAKAAANPKLAALSYRYSSPDLTFHHNPRSQVVVGKNKAGEDIAVSPTPFMWDSGGRNTVGADSPAAPPRNARGVFALKGLAGPQPGGKAAALTGSFQGGGTSSGVLRMVPDRAMLSAKNTVWPVFIDPPANGKNKAWTTVYSRYPDSSFWDGRNFNSGTTEARVGFESDTMGTSRSFFRLGWESNLKGADIKSATVRLRNTYSWSCQSREMQVARVGEISPETAWRESLQPNTIKQIGAKSFAHGWSGSCPDRDVEFDAVPVAQDLADEGKKSVTIRLMATDERNNGDGAYSWKKFNAEGESSPKINMIYNRKPTEPVNLRMSPGGGCSVKAPHPQVGKSDLVFSAKSSDPDKNLSHLDFEIWRSGSTTKFVDTEVPVKADGTESVTVLSTSPHLVDGATYHWAVRAKDDMGSYSTYGPPGSEPCTFVYDSRSPSSPKVDSPTGDFPEDNAGGVWSKNPYGSPGKFRILPGGTNEEVVTYKYSFNRESYDLEVTAADARKVNPSTGLEEGFVPLRLPPTAGPNVLYVKAVNGFNNESKPAKYLFYVTPRDKSDAPGDVTGDGQPDLYAIDGDGDLRLYPSDRPGAHNQEGELHSSLAAAHDAGIQLEKTSEYATYWMSSTGAPALISHNGDFMPADGVTDLVARMPDGKLYLYPGDGYGSFDINERIGIQLPSNAPAPSTFSQILAVGSVSGDKQPELFVTAGDALWAFTGYSGARFEKATQLSATGWTNRDLVNVGDVNGDGPADLVYRSFDTGNLQLRRGKAATGGGTDLASLGSAAASQTGTDTGYGTGWTAANIRLLMGTPDASANGTPDMWAVDGTGAVRFYSTTATGTGPPKTVITGGWTLTKAIG
ncbi:VCBS repeat-containing protein [Streptomyces sp. NPDC003691]